MSEPILELKNITKSFGDEAILKGISLQVDPGEFITLLGSSGCGKTTTLRIVAGLESADSGTVLLEGKDVTNEPPERRNVNMVFQNYALFPHMTVEGNIGYALRLRGKKKAEIRTAVAQALELVRLPGFEQRRPSELSGGQRQRVAIARAIVNEPRVLLLDEPLGALYLQLRRQMQIELKRLQQKLNITFVYVTHDQEEAMTMSDRIAVLQKGVIEQLDSPDEIYKHPASKFVANFIGESNLFDGTVDSVKGNAVHAKLADGGEMVLAAEGFREGDPITACVRPEVTDYSKEPVRGFDIRATVKNMIFIGSQYKMYAFMDNGQEIKINRTKPDANVHEGDAIWLHWEPEDAFGIREMV